MMRCPCCRSGDIRVFHEVLDVPVNSVLSLDNREEALRFPKGHIRLGLCQGCGFIHNTTFRRDRLEYSARYDPTQAYSPTFNRWHRRLAEKLIRRHGLRGRRIVEIGCGKGEFLGLLCRLGGNRGIGFDPAYAPDRGPRGTADGVEFVSDYFSERYGGIDADFVCCKMTLEHIDAPWEFVSMVRRALGHRTDVTVFFQVPDARRILEECAFWDVYYEHCAYFTAGSLARLFRGCGFSVRRVERAFGDQYLALEATPTREPSECAVDGEDGVGDVRDLVDGFATSFERQGAVWRGRIAERLRSGARITIWGSGSKGVAFLTTLGLSEEVQHVVDVNPHRQGKYMLGTGHRIVAPHDLPAQPPDVVIVMNPLYRTEISEELASLGLAPEVWTT
jgi:SAM-dependent methyltransferase